MKKTRFLYSIETLVVVFVIISFISCGAPTPVIGGPVEFAKLVDGVYDGSYKGGPNSALVKVTIKDKKIVNIEIVKNSAWKGKKVKPIIVKEIIEKQSTKVDAVSGATNSSNVIMNAVQKAIEKAYQS
jgi:uncharacterized protein with FMN-binding domain